MDPSPFFAELETAKAEVRAENCANFIDMTVSSPLRVGLPFDLEPAVGEAKADFGTWVADAAGRKEAREAVAEYYRERGGWFSAEQILLTASTSEAYSILFKTFCDPGDAILTPMPGYPLLDTLAQLEHLECYPYFLKLAREKERVAKCASFRFVIDTDSLLSAPDNAKILLLVSPHNPTGHCVSEKEWDEIVAFCEQRNMVLVVDEVFGDYAIDPKVRRSWEYLRRTTTNAKGECCGAACGPIAEPSIWQRSCKDVRCKANDDEGGVLDDKCVGRESRASNLAPRASLPKCPIFWLNGLSKTVGSPQLKLGWMAFYAPEKDFEQIRAALEFVADAYLSVSAPAQALAKPMLKHAAAYEAAIRERTSANWQTLNETFPNKYCPKVLGGWYAALRLGSDDEQLTLRLLREKHLLVQPGFFFDFDEDGWIVVSLLQPPEIFAEGVRRMLEMQRSSKLEP